MKFLADFIINLFYLFLYLSFLLLSLRLWRDASAILAHPFTCLPCENEKCPRTRLWRKNTIWKWSKNDYPDGLWRTCELLFLKSCFMRVRLFLLLLLLLLCSCAFSCISLTANLIFTLRIKQKPRKEKFKFVKNSLQEKFIRLILL